MAFGYRTVKFADGTEIEKCTYSMDRDSYVTYYMADLILFYVIPLLLTCVLYALIARILFTSSRSTASAASSTPERQNEAGDKALRAGAASADRKKTAAAALVPRRCTARPGKGSTNSKSSRIQVN